MGDLDSVKLFYSYNDLVKRPKNPSRVHIREGLNVRAGITFGKIEKKILNDPDFAAIDLYLAICDWVYYTRESASPAFIQEIALKVENSGQFFKGSRSVFIP